uniref:Structural maintenance of chromosomes protein 4-like n=1 Tax=Dermatophagoides pteronyssinus TaxID=6956 RepID=A0A6P6Y4Z7_DERPT|nr:structural maintenance of chromosomes protein 4-like [Dermatophagoides pteronyssinus]
MDRVVVRNFKTYAGEVTIGPLHRSLNAIIGANGSGKSNIVDAVCFCFGMRASRLRNKNLTGLIHQSQGLACSEAAVEIYLNVLADQSGGPSISSFSVGRDISLNSRSRYFLNGAVCSYADVEQKLSSYGVDLNTNRFLVLQGEIERLAALPPIAPDGSRNGLLELCESIIGTDVLVPSIAALEQKIAWYRLKHTLVCFGSLEEARKIAFCGKQKFRVVTLNGELIEKSGSISGGMVFTRWGDADLELVDSNPFASGVSLTVRPPGKSWRPLSSLSGGERTMTSLALIFALHHFKPSPFFFLDEIDAALDVRNVVILALFVRSNLVPPTQNFAVLRTVFRLQL